MEENIPDPRTVPLEEYEKLAAQYQTLCKKYRELEDKQTKYKAYIETANQKYRAAKQSARQWLAWIEKHKTPMPSSIPGSDVPAPKASAYNNVDGAGVTSSQTTEGDREDPQPDVHQAANDDDEVEVISARSVKRRKDAHMWVPTIVKQEPSFENGPIEVGSDDYSSPALKVPRPIRTETSDLAALVQHMDTPRKQRQRRATSEGEMRPATLLAATSSLSEGNHIASSEDSQFFKAEGGIDHAHRQSHTHTFSALPMEGVNNDNPLRERSINLPSPPAKSGNEANVHRKRKRIPDPRRISLFSEDGDERTNGAEVPRSVPDPAKFKSIRLNALLDEPAQDSDLLPGRSVPAKRSLQDLEAVTSTVKQENITQDDAASPAWPRSKRPRGLEKPPPPARPEDEPLRSRPLKALRLEDFKVNPNYVGTDFAVADTFRGREQRRCLQGCTRLECCGGALRKAIEIGGVMNTKSDNEVLEQYLGPDFKGIMAAYGPGKRKEIIIQARTYAFANQYGKHRHAFERRSTPPGFWRTDMPTTQEEERDHAAALEMEKKIIEDRRREAMRAGKWLFRDE